MPQLSREIQSNIKHLRLLAKQYPTQQSVCTEIINLRAILNLPKGTEHFLSDLHGEYEAFTHILNNCSGVIREKVDEVFSYELNEAQRSELCSLIYYPRRKLKLIREKSGEPSDSWFENTLLGMLEVCKVIASKYTRSKVRKASPPEFAYIIDELLHADYDGINQAMYYSKIMESILALSTADAFIVALASLIKRLAVDRLHIVGDIFDRGPRPDLIMDQLLMHHSVDIQWGNHDILWMGAAAGSEACIAAVVCNSAAFGNLKVLEEGYGINLRPLAIFAEQTCEESPAFRARMVEKNHIGKQDVTLAGKMYKAIAIMMFKLEGQVWMRNPEFAMNSRLLLNRLDLEAGTVDLNGKLYSLKDAHLPTVDPKNPWALTEEEARVLEALKGSFLHSERLHRHVRFLYSHGSIYKTYNQNVMFHGCIPTEEDGSFTKVSLCGKAAAGKELLDLAQLQVRQAYFGTGEARRQAQDVIWYLWCGKDSPLFGRHSMTTFERLFLTDEATWTERKNPYYRYIDNPGFCEKILTEFGLYGEHAHIINGHVPVRAGAGESPIRGGGRLIVIDGGFCKAYQPRTGIAGYTLIYNSWGMRLSAHMPFETVRKAVEQNMDIHSTTSVFESLQQRMMVMDTDIGQQISEQIYDLSLLLQAYRLGHLAASI